MKTEQAPATATILTIAEAAFELRCCASTVYREITAGKLVARRIRGKTFVHRDDLAAYLEAARYAVRPPDEAGPKPLTRRQVSLRDSGLIDGDDFGYRPQKG